MGTGEARRCWHQAGDPQQYVRRDYPVEIRSLEAARHVASRRCEQMPPLIVVPGLLTIIIILIIILSLG